MEVEEDEKSGGQQKLEAWESGVREERKLWPNRVSVGRYEPWPVGRVRLTQNRGKRYRTMGDADGQQNLLHVEEALHLMERNSLLLYAGVEPQPVSLSGAYHMLQDARRPLDLYLVYAELKKSSFVVRPTPTPQSSPSSKVLKALIAQQKKKSLSDQAISDQAISETHPESGKAEDAGEKGVPAQSRASEVRDGGAEDPDAFLERLKQMDREDREVYDRNPLQYDVWTLTKTFKRSDPGPPLFRVAMLHYHSPVPSLRWLDVVKRLSQHVPVRLAVVDRGVVTLSEFRDFPPT